MPGKFHPDILRMLDEVIGTNATVSYVLPDSSNTKIYPLNAWPVGEKTVIVETNAGNAGESCGAQLYVARYSMEDERWATLLHTCGAVDTVLPVSHNGLFDFVLCDKWDMDHWAFRFDGTRFVETELYAPSPDELEVRTWISAYEGYGAYLPDVSLSYIHLGKEARPFILAGEAAAGKYLFARGTFGKIGFVCAFPGAMQVDFLEHVHKGMPDIRTFDVNYVYGSYEWNGQEYVRVSEEKWVCPL